MVAPTILVVKNRSGTPQIFPLLLGTVLGTQDGSDFGAVETGVNNNYRTGNRIIEAFGKRFVSAKHNIYERDEGGSGVWGSVHARSGNVGGNSDGSAQSGLHLLHPNGVPTITSLYFNGGSGIVFLTTSTDGVSWSDTSLGVGSGSTPFSGHSIAFRDSIFWLHQPAGNAFQVVEHRLTTNTTTTYSILGNSHRGAAFAIVNNELYLHGFTSNNNVLNDWLIFRFTGISWVTVTSLTGFKRKGTSGQICGSCCWADGDDLIIFAGGETAPGAVDGDTFYRITDPAGSPTVTDVTTLYLTSGNGADIFAPGGGSAVEFATWDVLIDNDTNPGQAPAIYLWRYGGSGQAGTRTAWTFNYRQITHGTVTGTFSVNEIVTGTTSGATAKIAAVGSGFLSLTNVDESGGVFQSGEPLTTLGGSATSSSLLIEQPFTSDGTSISAIFALPHTVDGIGIRIPTKPAARAEIGDTANPPEETAAGTKYFFRVYGTGSIGVITIYISGDEEAPDTVATLTGSVVVESGSPATTPVRSGNTITNVTPDDGVALYSFVHDVATDGLSVGDTFGLMPKIV